MPTKLDAAQMADLGAVAGGEIMDNGEKRFRLMVGNVGYIWTEPPTGEQPKWQNAHSHRGVIETYIVQRGKMAMAFEGKETRRIEIYGPGDVVSTVPGGAHNVYLYAGSAIHTVKHGEAVGNPEKGGADWYPADNNFDTWTKSLTEQDIEKFAPTLR